MTKRNFPKTVLYPEIGSDKPKKRTVTNVWQEKEFGIWLYKLDSGFQVVDESELAKYQKISW